MGAENPKGYNRSRLLISSYLQHRSLMDMGYQQNIEDLDDFEAQVFILIHSTFKELESDEMKRRK